MIALPIASTILVFIVYLFVFLPFFKYYLKKYDAKTKIKLPIFIGGLFCILVLNVMPITLSFVWCCFKNDNEGTIIVCLLLFLFLLPNNLCIFMPNTCFEGIIGDNVYIYRFTKMHIINISDIVEIRKQENFNFLGEFMFYCKNNFRFEMNSSRKGFNECLSLVYKKMRENNYESFHK